MKNYKKLKGYHGWVGGKSKLANDIVELLPKHEMYVEVFGGALNVLFAKEKIKLEVVNDINGELINMHRAVRKSPESLSFYLKQFFISRELFYDMKFERYKPRNNIERAAIYYYLLSQSFGSIGSTFAMSTKAKRKPKDIYKSFDKWSKRLRFTTIENMSFEKLIKTYDRDGALFYCDPPYYKTEKYYKNIGEFGEVEHRLLADTLKKIDGNFLVSYNDCEFIRELYKDFKIVESKEIDYTLGKNVQGKSKRVREIFIMNY
jgi:DNA adenine methylase